MDHDKNKKDALAQIYQEYVASMYSYGCKFTSDKELVKDCIHDVFIRMYDKENLSSIRNMKFYLLRALRNCLIDALSENQTLIVSDDINFSVFSQSNLEDEFLNNEENEKVKKTVNDVFASLTDRQREAIYLYYIEELEYDKICQIMKMNYQSVRNLIHRGITRLREKFAEK